MSSSSSPIPAQPSPRPVGGAPLDGEVLPPTMRVLHPTPDDHGPTAPAGRPSFRLKLGTALLVGAVVASTGGMGVLGASAWMHRAAHAAAGPSPTMLALSRLGQEVADLKASVDSVRQDETGRALRRSVDQLKAELDGLRGSDAAAIAQMNARLDKPAPAAPSTALSDVASRLDKLDHDPRLADITARLDRIERQVSSPTPTGSVPVAGSRPAVQSIVAQAAAPKAPVRPAVLDNYIVRDVYSGIALVEGRSGSVREVVPGEVLPGAGEVRSIERHGRNWVVVTSRGVIDTETW